MEKITQKEFKTILENNHNALIASNYFDIKNIDNIKNKIINTSIQNEKLSTWRKANKIQTNALQFSDNSWLYFDNEANKKEYYKQNNLVINFEYYGDKFLAIIYAIKEI